MTVQSFQNHVIEKLVTVELKVAELYQVYAEKFSDHHQFWEKIVKEEMQHAKWLKRLNTIISEDPVLGSVVLDRFSLDLIKSTLKNIDGYIARAKDAEMTLSIALQTALEVENTIVEKSFYEIFESDNDELKHLFEALNQESWQHADKIQRLLKDIS